MKKNIQKLLFLMMTVSGVYAASDIPTFDSYDKEQQAMEKEVTDEWRRDARANNPNFDALPKSEQDKLVFKEGLAAMERTRPDIEAYRDYAEKYGSPQEKEEAKAAIANLERVQESIRSGVSSAESERAAADLDKQMRKDFDAEKAATTAQPEPSRPAPTASAAELAKQRADTERETQKTSLDKDIADLKRQQSAERASGFASTNTDRSLADAEERRAALEPRPAVASTQDKPTPSAAVTPEPAKPASNVSTVASESLKTENELKKERVLTQDSSQKTKDAHAEMLKAQNRVLLDREPSREEINAAQARGEVVRYGEENYSASTKTANEKALDAANLRYNTAAEQDRMRPTVAGVTSEPDKSTSVQPEKKPSYLRRIFTRPTTESQKAALDKEISTLTAQRDSALKNMGGMQAPTEYDAKLQAAMDKRDALDAPKKPGVLQRTGQSIRSVGQNIQERVAAYQLKQTQAKLEAARTKTETLTKKMGLSIDDKKEAALAKSYEQNRAREAALEQKAKALQNKAPAVRRPVPTTRY